MRSNYVLRSGQYGCCDTDRLYVEIAANLMEKVVIVFLLKLNVFHV